MVTYSKAFLFRHLQQFPGWPASTVTGAAAVDNGTDLRAAHVNPEEVILYLHDDFTVTDGPFRDDRVVFEKITPEWIGFCTGTLGFAPTVQQVERVGE
jgi:hypothetical protein